MRINNFDVRRDSAPYVIAEIGVNHENDLERARRMIRQVAAAGGHAAKFQTYRAEMLASRFSPSYWDLSKEPTTSQYELFRKYDRFGEAEYQALAEECESAGIAFLSTPFDLTAVEMLSPMVPLFKIASADITNRPLLEAVAAQHKPVVLSTGASTMDEVAAAVGFLATHGNPEVALLHCVLAYPTAPEDANLRVIETLLDRFPDHVIGYSDHVPPDPGMHTLSTAYALGARIIEKHFTDDKSLPGNDHYHAMDDDDLRTAMAAFDHVGRVRGDGVKRVSPPEREARTFARRSLVAARALPAGRALAPEDLAVKRPGTGIPPTALQDVLGARLIRAMVEDEILTLAHLDVGRTPGIGSDG